jgi:hypothetical protein
MYLAESYGMASSIDAFTIESAFAPFVSVLVIAVIAFALTKSRHVDSDSPLRIRLKKVFLGKTDLVSITSAILT